MNHYPRTPRITLKLTRPRKRASDLSASNVAEATTLDRPDRVEREVRRILAPEPFECFIVFGLTAKHSPIGWWEVSRGTMASTPVHPVNVFGPAVGAMTIHGVIVAHNHPSGDPSPSPEDIAVTRRLIEAGRILGIQVLDHLIVGERKCVSIRSQQSDLFARS